LFTTTRFPGRWLSSSLKSINFFAQVRSCGHASLGEQSPGGGATLWLNTMFQIDGATHGCLTQPVSRFDEVMAFSGDKVARETQYFADPFEASTWRAQWVERMGEGETRMPQK
jgi:hypothetical protein